jgi:transposase
MSRCRAVVVVLSAVDEAVLRARARAARSEHRDVVRAKIVLAAAAGEANESIAAALGLCVDTVRKWRSRFAARGLAGLDDLPRGGRPRRFTPVQVAQVKALACTLPAETGLPLSRFSSAELAAEVITRGLVESVSPATVRRWLNDDAIKPWQHRSWIFPRDPLFAAKAGPVLDLYDRRWGGQDLGEDEYVISADESGRAGAR